MRLLAAAGALLVLTSGGGAAQPIHRHFTPADRETGRYQYVPFDVAAGTESLTISYRYSGDAQGASTIDLGLFEPGPLTLGTASFRGYSGGAQRTITVGRLSASPGYRAGALPAGTWHVLLGLYKVAAEGVDVDVEIAASRTAETPPANGRDPRAPDRNRANGDRASSITAAGRRWYSGALHLHTTHSDGTVGPAQVAAIARQAGLDFLSITDHNNTTWTREPLPAAPMVIVGEEVTTPAGHADVWGLRPGGWIDFRVTPAERDAAERIDSLVDAAHRAGALFSINHPFGDCAGCSWQHAIPAAVDAIEIWNGGRGPQPEAVALWDRWLGAGRHVTAVGASDWHRTPAPIDAAAVRVLANSLTERAIIQALRGGRAIVVRDAKTPPPIVAARCGSESTGIGGTLRCTRGDSVSVDVHGLDNARATLVVNGGVGAAERVGSDGITLTATAVDGYLRVHVLDATGGAIAITNPIYVSTR